MTKPLDPALLDVTLAFAKIELLELCARRRLLQDCPAIVELSRYCVEAQPVPQPNPRSASGHPVEELNTPYEAGRIVQQRAAERFAKITALLDSPKPYPFP